MPPASPGPENREGEKIAGDAIADLFIERILNGANPPGSRLTEREIASVAGCTHARAREALHHLEKAGAVRIFRHRGAVVLSVEDAPPVEIEAIWTQLLALLEGLAGERLSRSNPDLDARAQLAAETHQLHRLGALAGDPKLTILLKRLALHRAIVSVSS